MKFNKIIYLILISASLLSGQAGNYKFRHYSINDGLVESMVLSVLQDSKGFMWFGSSGLSRFDGYKFVNYINHADDSTSLVSNQVNALFEDSKGRIWVGTRAGISIYNRDNDKFAPAFEESYNSQLNITCFNEDSEGNIYIGTNGLGLICYNPKTKNHTVFRYREGNNDGIVSDWISKIVINNKQEIWISTYHGLCRFDNNSQKFIQFKRTNYKNSDWAKDAISSIAFDKEGNIWLATRYGITRLSPASREYKDFVTAPASNSNNIGLEVRALAFVNEFELWAGTQNGLIVLNTKTGKNIKVQHQENDFESLGGDEIEDLYLDKSNNLWVATRAAGVDKLKFLTERFYHYKNTNPAYKNLSSNEIYGITEDKDGNIWFATLNGLNKFYSRPETFQHFMKKDFPGITNDLQWTVYTNKKNRNDLLWVGTESGLFVFSISKNKVVNPFRDQKLLDTLKSEKVLSIALDEDVLWIGCESGLISINLKTEKIKHYLNSRYDKNSTGNAYVWRLLLDSKKNLWVCTTNGLNILKAGADKFQLFLNKKNDPNSLINNEVCEIYEDSDDIYWVGTSDGLAKFDSRSGKFYRISLSAQAETIYSIQKDNTGKLWIGTGRGLVRYNPADGSSIVYDIEDGVQSNEFNFPSLATANGEFYFTGVNGFNVFYPEDIQTNKFIPPVYITSFSVMNKPIKTGETVNGRIILEKSIEFTKEITLNYDENIISLEFASLDYQSPGKNQYMYIMENFESDWNNSGNRRFVTYKLGPGTYIFKVKGTNSDKVWNEKPTELIIIVRPPWWNTIWFRILAITALVLLLYIFLKQRTKNLVKQKAILERLVSERTSELNKQQQIVEEQAERIQQTNLELEQLNTELEKRVVERTAELEKAKIRAERADEIKSEFLAQMSHEIRSPINVVLSFSNLIRSEVEDKIDPDLKEGFKSIANAGKRIIRTVDLLLNMSEIQTQTFEFIPSPVDLVKDVLDSVLPEYHFAAKEKSISLITDNNATNVRIIGDHYSLEQIIANLVDNAIKYTTRGEVRIKTFNNDAGDLVCEVTDTGIGMSKEFMNRIFVPFSQEETGYTRKYEGNGLGLALVKKYCELNNIDLTVSSEKGKGSTFSLRFTETIPQNSNK